MSRGRGVFRKSAVAYSLRLGGEPATGWVLHLGGPVGYAMHLNRATVSSA